MKSNPICWTIVSVLVTIIENLGMAYCFYYLARPFMKQKKSALYAGVIYFFSMMLVRCVLHRDSFEMYAFCVLLAYLALCWIDRRSYEQKVFLAMTFFLLRWFASAMAEVIYDNLYSFAENTDFMQKHLDLWLALYIVVCLVYLVFEFLFIGVSVWCILKAYVYKYADMAKGELLMLLMPLFAGVSGYIVIHCYRRFYIIESGENRVIYDVLALLYYGVTIMILVVVVVLYQSIKAKQEEGLQNELLATQIGSMERHIGQVESLYQNIRSIRHDMTNHIMTLERLYEKNELEEAKRYSTELKMVLAKAAGTIKSGNPVTDVILQEKKQAAEQRHMNFYSDFHYPAETTINAFDVSVILNNALQNAIENAGGCETPYISISSYRRKNAYMIEIKNSFKGTVQWDVESGLPLTSKCKTDKQTHGYGLKNIRRVAAKYFGEIDIAVANGEFCLSILLMNTNEDAPFI